MIKSFEQQEYEAWEGVSYAYRIRDIDLLFSHVKKLMVIRKRIEDREQPIINI